MRKKILVGLFLLSWLIPVMAIAGTVQLPKTGQTGCWDILHNTIDCAGTGQDGEIQVGVAWPDPRFTDNGDQTITDNLTGLMWTKDANAPGPEACEPGTAKTWQEALDYVACLNSNNYLNHSDWRLPNINELESLVNADQEDQASWLNTQGFVNIWSDGGWAWLSICWWSSSSYKVDASQAWVFDPYEGCVVFIPKTFYRYAWPVRAGDSGKIQLPQTGQKNCFNEEGSIITCADTGQDGDVQAGVIWPLTRFTDNGDQTVTDNLTGLMWTKDGNFPGPAFCAPDKNNVQWWFDLNYIACLNDNNYLNYNDWRLPNRKELRSLVNYNEENSANWLNSLAFTNAQDGWSSTTRVAAADCAWLVSINVGVVSPFNTKDTGLAAWPVRSGPVNITKTGPTLASPAAGATVNTASLTFTWSAVADTTSYEILVDNNSGFGSPELNETIAAPTTSRTVVNHLPDNVYSWKVRAKFADGSYTAWSAVQTFTYQLPVSASAFWVPLYRLYNPVSKDHFYTTIPSQRDTARSSGYTYEKIEAYVSDRKFNDTSVGYLFRLYHPTSDVHFYTSSESEKDARISAGYTYEGIVGFVYTAAMPGMAPLYYLEHAANTDNFYTISKYERDNAINTYGFTDHSIQCYVSSSAVANNRPQGMFAGIGMSNGALSIPFTDIALKGVGPALTMTRYYNSYNFYDLPFGGGWSHSLYSYAIEHPIGTVNDVTVRWGNGTEDFFKNDGSNNFSGINGTFSKLVRVNDDKYELTAKDQTVYTFSRVTVNTMGASFIPDLPLIGIQDKFGNKVTLSPNAVNGRIDRADRMVNGTTTVQSIAFNYDGNNRLASIVDKSVSPNRTVTYGYNENGLLASVTDARGNATYYTYTAERLLNTITYPEGNTVTVTYDLFLRAASYTNGTISLTFDYNESTGTTVKNGDSPLVNFTHDPLHRADKITYAGNTGDYVKSAYLLGNQLNLPSDTTDRNGYYTYFTYDDSGNVKSVKNAKNESTRFEYDDKNNLTAIVDPRNETYRTVLAYDTATKTKLESITLPLGEKTSFEYFDNGLLKKRTDPTGHKFAYTYDGSGNLTQITDEALSTHVDFTPDGAGRVLSKTDPYAVLSPTNQQSVGTIYAYDENDNVTSVKVGSKPASIYTFDRNNRMTHVTDPRSKVTHFTYNAMNLLESQTSPDGKTWSYIYNSLGKVQTVNRPDSTAMTYEYDANNRLWKTYLNGSLNVTYAYDANGNIKTVSEDGRTTTMNYDEVNRISDVQDPFGNTVGYGYDEAGNRISITYPGAKKVIYTYDADNRLCSVHDWLTYGSAGYQFSAQGVLQSITNINGTARTFTYDSADRLTDIANKKADNTAINDYHLTLNAVNMPTRIVRNGEPALPVPASSSTGYGYNDANQITSAGAVNYTHDLLGNVNGASDGRSLTFDYANRLIQSTIAGEMRSYAYDALGNRISRTTGGTDTRYLLDINGGMSQILAEMDSANTVKNYYIYGDGNLLFRISNTGQRFTYHHDHLGNTTAVTDDGGIITEQYGYDEYGKVLVSGPASAENPFRYVGQFGVMDEGNGLLFMRARYYDTSSGRFLSRDPLGFGGGDLNLYAYVGANPVMHVDYSGLAEDSLRVELIGNSLSLVKDFSVEASGSPSLSVLSDTVTYTDAYIQITYAQWRTYQNAKNQIDELSNAVISKDMTLDAAIDQLINGQGIKLQWFSKDRENNLKAMLCDVIMAKLRKNKKIN